MLKTLLWTTIRFLRRKIPAETQASEPFRAEILTSHELADRAARIAAEHEIFYSRESGRELYRRFNENASVIHDVHRELITAAHAEEALPPGTEWLLDNYHLVVEHIREIRKHLPRAYYRTLPKLKRGRLAGSPRIYDIALEIIEHTDAILSTDSLTTFIEGYQEEEPLAIGELWALPSMLRLGLIDNIRRLVIANVTAKRDQDRADQIVATIFKESQGSGTDNLLELASFLKSRKDLALAGTAQLVRRLRGGGPSAALALQWIEEQLREKELDPDELVRKSHQTLAANQISLGNSITALRTLAGAEWDKWVESVSRLERVLRGEASGIYSRSDFQTRDLCRHEVERLARGLAEGEVKIAHRIVRYADEAFNRQHGDQISQQFPARPTYLGYFLIDQGIEALEKALGYLPPATIRLSRFLRPWKLPLYLLSIVGLTIYLAGLAAALVFTVGGDGRIALLTGLLLMIPFSEISIALLQWLITHLTKPTLLPKLDFEEGLSREASTIVAVHTLLFDREQIDRAVEQLEVRYLGNDDQNLTFALLADLQDANSEVAAPDADLIGHVARRVASLNQRYCSAESPQFCVLIRGRQYSKGEGKYICWERKRGKLVEFNHLILQGDLGSFQLLVGELTQLVGRKYVITLDGDTQLPRGSASKLIGTIAHPLNQPEFDPQTQIVRQGYGVIQPRIGPNLTSASATRFANIYSGHAGLDPYTMAVSDVYQDLFAESSYLGKGIYNVAAFEHALHGRIPEYALLSHDLFEGNFARVGLASDLELLDEFPASFSAFARRQHRWIRGDWQLLPWLMPNTPAESGRAKNQISALGLWKLFDNLRRSLVDPLLFAFLMLAWLSFIPGPVELWTMLVLFVSSLSFFTTAMSSIAIPQFEIPYRSQVEEICDDLLREAKRAALALAFFPQRAFLASQAITVTLWRMFVSQRHLLEWQTADQASRSARLGIAGQIKELRPTLIIAVISGVLIALFSPTNIGLVAPFIALWLCAPFISSAVSRPARAIEDSLSAGDIQYLRQAAWDTWSYFDDFLNPSHNYLIPDNLQLVPKRIVANRTSPTNIGLSLLCIVGANDLGFIIPSTVVSRLGLVLATLRKLERFRGHFLNWYETTSTRALYPRYVSTVDSGNLAAYLIAIRSALYGYRRGPFVSNEHLAHLAWRGSVLAKNNKRYSAEICSALGELAIFFSKPCRDSGEWSTLLSRLKEEHLTHLLALAPEGQADDPEIRQLSSFVRDVENLASLDAIFQWIPLYREIRDTINSLASNPLNESVLRLTASIDRFVNEAALSPRRVIRMRRRIEALAGVVKEIASDPETVRQLEAKILALRDLFDEAFASAEQILAEIDAVIAHITRINAEIDFQFLYDQPKRLFRIGYRVDDGAPDNGRYDLLASEARTTSLVAIALGQVPQRHWFALGRAFTTTRSGKALLSWAGTMFEYLMPLLVTHEYPGTLLSKTYRAVVRAQQEYGRRKGVPWGCSESGYSGVDFEKTYQYKAFGVPGLGLKRGLAEDLVISPYSSFLALSIDPLGCIENLRTLEREGARGEYGFYEAIDYTSERLTDDERHHVVQSFLAHHQGMSLISIVNLLCGVPFRNRFHSDPAIRSTELLLHEKYPRRVETSTPHKIEAELADQEADHRAARGERLFTPHSVVPRTRLLSNGRYTVMVDNAGSGFSLWDRNFALTRWREDQALNHYGSYCFIRDRDSNRVWSTTYQPTKVEPRRYEVFFNPDKIEFRRSDFEIVSHTEITVSPEDNVEIRRISLTNTSRRRRSIELTSYGEVVLDYRLADTAHPAFSKMFVESEFLSGYDALIFGRRRRSPEDPERYLLHLMFTNTVWEETQFDSSREKFIGRGGAIQSPRALQPGARLQGSAGYVLDPIFSLRSLVELDPGESQTVVFVTAYADSREEILRLASHYREEPWIRRAFEMAWSQSNVELRHEQFTIAQTHTFQHLANALFFNIESLRPDSERIASSTLSREGLWRVGISGDHPIVTLRINDQSRLTVAAEALLAHEFLRLRGISFDLILLNEYPGGYLQELQDSLESLVRHSPAGRHLDRPGGVFLRSVSQISKEERLLILAVSRVVLDSAHGSLAKQLSLKSESKRVPRLPTSSTARKVEQQYVPVVEPREFDNGIGGFINGGTAYALTLTPETIPPLPWSNVIANPNFGFLATERGGGFTWAENSRENRFSPWSNDPVSDPAGEAIYLAEQGRKAVWSPLPASADRGFEFTVRHRFGSSEFETQQSQIFSQVTLSSSTTDRVKWYNVRLINRSDDERKLEVYFYLDWMLGVDLHEARRLMVSGFDERAGVLYATLPYNAEYSHQRIFIGSSLSIQSYTTDRLEFLGRNGSISEPALLSRMSEHSLVDLVPGEKSQVELSKRVGAGFDSAAVIRVNLTLTPREEKEFTFFVAQAHSSDEIGKLSRSFGSPRHRKEQFALASKQWDDLVSRSIQVTTPERSFDIMLNGWLLYQTLSCRLYGRSGFYQSGGAFGFRDQLQDSLGMLYSAPEITREQILLHASRHFLEGDVQHWWHPPLGRGVRTRMTDDYLWLPYAVSEYLRVTGDRQILDVAVPFLEGDALAEGEAERYSMPRVSTHKATLYEHCIIALDRAHAAVGAHGLPLIGSGDWNDGMNRIGLGGKGESVWLGWFLHLVTKNFVGLIQQRNDKFRVDQYRGKLAALEKALEEHGWDGAWYRRAFFDDGTPVGSSANDECQIDSLSQSWAVLSGVASAERAAQAMNSAYDRLVDKDNRVIKLLSPPFNSSPLEPGYIKGYPPGIRENGAQYTHAAAWIIKAFSMLGDGDRALELFQLINPIEITKTLEGVERYGGEPYVYCGDVYSVPPHAGRAGWSWYTGSAAWLYRVAVEDILGIKISGDTLRIDPCIPKDWDGCKVVMRRGEATLEIEIINRAKTGRKVTALKINGEIKSDKEISLVNDIIPAKVNTIEVVL